MAKAIIFGGAGFVGTHLAEHLLAEGYEDVVVADVEAPGQSIPGSRHVTCDVRQPIDFAFGDESYEVYNFAAVHRTPGHRDDEYFETNIQGAKEIIAFCESRSIRRLLFTSTMSVYGPSEERKTEESRPEPVSAYGKSKLEAENLHRAWADGADGRRLVIVRPAVVFGRGENGNFTRLAQILRRHLFVYPGRRDTVKACCYVEDLVESFEFAFCHADSVFVYNFAYPHAYTIEEICGTFHDVLGYPRPRFRVPLGPMLFIGSCFEVLAKLGVRTPVHRERLMKLVRSTNIWPGALLGVGYEFDSELEDGLRRWRNRCQGTKLC